MTIKVQVSDAFPLPPLASQQIVTAAGTTTVLPATQVLIFRKAVLSDSPFSLPAGVNGAKIRGFDETGLAGTMTATPFGTDKIMGVNGSFLVASSGGNPQSGGTFTLEYFSSILGWVAGP